MRQQTLQSLPQMQTDLAALNQHLADIETALTAIAPCGMYYTPSEIVDFVAGSGTYLVDSSIIGNPPYES